MSATLVLARIARGPELAVLVEDRRVVDWVFGPAPGAGPEAIYKARVERAVPGAGAVFVSLGASSGDASGQGYLRDARGLASGRVLLVEATAFPEADKAVPVSPRVLFRQRYTIHTPGAPGINVARGIGEADERARLQSAVEAHIASLEDWLGRRGEERAEEAGRVRRLLEAHRTGGTILRSAARGQPAERILRDLDRAVGARLDAEDALADPTRPTGPVAPPPLPREYALREWGDRVGRVVIASGPGAGDFDALPADEEARLSPLAGRIDRMPDPLDQFGVWDEIERMRGPRADLPSGGWMAVEATSAMVTVDVNTGAAFSPGAAVTANVEAARELPRQLRLRGLGGQVAIDWAPLKKAERRRVEDTLKSAFRRDPVETTLAGWTPLGHVELQRKRERRPIAELLAAIERAPG